MERARLEIHGLSIYQQFPANAASWLLIDTIRRNAIRAMTGRADNVQWGHEQSSS